MISKMMAMANEDLPRLKQQEPFSPEEERATVIAFGKDEIGLLDIVLLEGLTKSEACNR